MKIGFIGLGIMGRPMAQRLLETGFTLTVHDRADSRSAGLAAAGARAAASSGEVAAASDVIITMVPDTPDVREVLFGDQGIASGLAPGKIVIDMSTISPSATVEFAQRLRERRCEMLDAPVSGGETGAAAGTLSIMVGGSPQTYEKCLPVFRALGKTIAYTGSSGNGQKTELVNQVVGALNLLAAAEGLRLTQAAKLNPETTLQVISGGVAVSWMLVNLGPKMLQGDFSPGFRIRLQHKDLRLAREWIAELGLSLPGTELICSLLTRAMEMGLEEQGNQGIYNLLERLPPH
jgi:3-hydroxyisobutyrate dehydrogenase-like beta-hydroxyacid dehydrogenase